MPAGTYYIGVDAYDTTGHKNKLQCEGLFYRCPAVTAVQVYDWFSVELTSVHKISVSTTDGSPAVLVDSTGTNTLAFGTASADGEAVSFVSQDLDPGVYYIGVGSDLHSMDTYSLNIQLQ